MSFKRRTVSKSLGKWLILAASVLVGVMAVYYAGPFDPNLNPSTTPGTSGTPGPSGPYPTATIPEFPSSVVVLLLLFVLITIMTVICMKKMRAKQ